MPAVSPEREEEKQDEWGRRSNILGSSSENRKQFIALMQKKGIRGHSMVNWEP